MRRTIAPENRTPPAKAAEGIAAGHLSPNARCHAKPSSGAVWWVVTPSGDAVVTAHLVHLLCLALDRLGQHERRHNGAPMSGTLAEVRSELYRMGAAMSAVSPPRPQDVPSSALLPLSDQHHVDRISTKEAATMLGVGIRQARRLLVENGIGEVHSGRLVAPRAQVEDLASDRRNRDTWSGA